MELIDKYENMKTQYRETQKKLKESLLILSSYNGNRAIDIWDTDVFSSKEWELKCKTFVQNCKNKKKLIPIT